MIIVENSACTYASHRSGLSAAAGAAVATASCAAKTVNRIPAPNALADGCLSNPNEMTLLSLQSQFQYFAKVRRSGIQATVHVEMSRFPRV